MLTSGPSIQTDKIYTFCLFGRNSLSNPRGGREKKKEKEDREGRVKCVEGGWNSEELKRAEARSKGKKELSGLGIVVSGGKKGGGTWWTGSRPEFPYVFLNRKRRRWPDSSSLKKKEKKKLLETERATFKSIVMLKNCQAFKNRWWRNTNTVTTNTVTFYSDDFMLNPIFLRLSENAHLCCGVIVFSIFISSFFLKNNLFPQVRFLFDLRRLLNSFIDSDRVCNKLSSWSPSKIYHFLQLAT